jgi:Flp pilus assembly protein CpaB
VTGGFLVALAALGVFVAARGASQRSSHDYVVVGRDVVAGTTLTRADLTLSSMDLPEDLAARSFTDPAALVGRIAVAHLAPGDLVQASTVVGGDAADSRVQLSIPVERARAMDGLLQPGERVDVLATYGTDGGQTLVVTRGAEVRRVDNGARGALATSDSTILTLAVADPDEVLAVTHASQAGKVTIVRSTGVQQRGSSSYQPPDISAG